MEPLELVAQRLVELREDQRAGFDRLEGKLDRHVHTTEGRLDQLDRRTSRWAGGLAVVSAMLGSAIMLLVTAARAKWGS